jgi:microcystin degradation protein MlrC
MVVGDNKKNVERGAKKLSEQFWSVRNEFEFVAPTATLPEVFENSIHSTKRPYFISDMGDNPTAGGAGDVTWTLQWLLQHENKIPNGKRLIYASIPGPSLVAAAKKVGVGGKVDGEVGAIVDNRYAPPVEIDGVVEKIIDDPSNSQVVVRVGKIEVIVTDLRTPFHYERDFDLLDLKPREADIIVVKLGYLTEELYDKRGDWMMAHTRGGVDQELTQLPYKRLIRPIFPLDENMEDPPLIVEFM